MRKIQLFHKESPLYRLNYRIGQTNVWIKRDDLLDFAFGGNKVRLFEYIAALVSEEGVSRLVTYGSTFSNYLRVAATVCAKMGWQCDIIIINENDFQLRGGNAHLLRCFDVNILHCTVDQAHEFIDDYQGKLRKAGVHYAWIPGGGHLPEAAFGYVDASEEILHQAEEQHLELDAVFLPCGTGTTQAGLIYGLSSVPTKVVGATVARDEKTCVKVIQSLLKAMNSLESNPVLFQKEISVVRYDKLKYGGIDSSVKNVICRMAVSDGIFLDPIYNARAFLAMEKYIRRNPLCKNVLYLNTGGQPNLFLNT